MGLSRVGRGDQAPEEFHVIIEIPAHSPPIKYEVDKATGALFVDRFLSCSMHYPCDYGYIPHTLSEDGDPVDVLVISPIALTMGCVVSCRAIGMLKMTDEAGPDMKILAVPSDNLTTLYLDVHQPADLPTPLLEQISHFFEHYKDLEKHKWVKLHGWTGAAEAKVEIQQGMNRYDQLEEKPAF